jgi:hypothetical protein
LRTGAVRFTFSLDSSDADSARRGSEPIMPTDHIRYDLLAQEALRGVVRRVLVDVARNGLPGEHHFYVTFDTRAPGLKISDRLKAEHPEEMTIVLQHQFWDLAVTDQGFEVGLSFKGIPERLVIPFEAIKGFFDPSVQFGLQFETLAGEPAAGPAETQDAKRRGPGQAIAPAAPAAEPKLPLPAQSPAGADEPEPRPPGEGAEVVRLDRFRKK